MTDQRPGVRAPGGFANAFLQPPPRPAPNALQAHSARVFYGAPPPPPPPPRPARPAAPDRLDAMDARARAELREMNRDLAAFAQAVRARQGVDRLQVWRHGLARYQAMGHDVTPYLSRQPDDAFLDGLIRDAIALEARLVAADDTPAGSSAANAAAVERWPDAPRPQARGPEDRAPFPDTPGHGAPPPTDREARRPE
jgi:hypothetical protein